MRLVLIVHNIRSTHNVGSILRTADGFGVAHVYFTGYTPYPTQAEDTRLPHIRNKLTEQIHKTALGAELSVPNEHIDNILTLIGALKGAGYAITALEQSENSTPLNKFKSPEKVALLLGEETKGITPDLLGLCDSTLEIPMSGRKESFNVSVATGIALYQIMLKS